MKKLMRITVNINREALAQTALKSGAFYATSIKEAITEQLGEDWEDWYNYKVIQKDIFEDNIEQAVTIDCLLEVTTIPELEEMESRWEFGV